MHKSIFRMMILFVCLSMGMLIMAQDDKYAIEHDGLTRDYTLFVPSSYDEAEALPLVIALHPGQTDGSTMQQLSGFDRQGESFNTLIVYPSAMNGNWNRQLDANRADDLGFIQAVIGKVSQDYTVDTSRIYAFGYSNGGGMAYRLRCAMPEQLAGVAVYASPLEFALAEECLDAKPLPFLLLHGTADQLLSFTGNAFVREGQLQGYYSPDQTVTLMASLNGCGLNPSTNDVSVAGTRNPMIQQVFSGCTDDASAEFIIMRDVDHYNFGGRLPITLPDGSNGTVGDAVWEFFLRHPSISDD